jgi:hypothetical protein
VAAGPIADTTDNFNTNNPIYFKYHIPPESKMLVYVLGAIQQLQGMYEVTGTIDNQVTHDLMVKSPLSFFVKKQMV